MGEAEAPTGLTIAEKVLGLVILVLGVLAIYYTYQALEAIGALWPVFVSFGVLLLLVGLALILARAE
ncbi:MAG TPA: hypothetical protein ENF34_01620 [Candidatus Bathyarchaeota archaeon]|nr:hypothetical protein [Candidatus Bathyarchaeota archaeon]